MQCTPEGLQCTPSFNTAAPSQRLGDFRGHLYECHVCSAPPGGQGCPGGCVCPRVQQLFVVHPLVGSGGVENGKVSPVSAVAV